MAAEGEAPSFWLDVEHCRVPVWVSGAGTERVVITSHGLTNDHRDAPLFKSMRDQLLRQGGTRVIEFDYPGSGAADGELKDKRFWILHRALEAVVSAARNDVAGAPVAIVARSMGGTVALATAPATQPSRMALMSPPYELTRNIAALRGEPNSEGLYPLPAWAPPSGQVKGVPALSPEFFEELDREEEQVMAAARTAVNTLLISSTEDPKVESDEMQRLWGVLSRERTNKHLIVDSDHNYETAGEEVQQAIISWICG